MKLKKVIGNIFNDYRNWDGAASLSFYFIFSIFPAIIVFLTTVSLLHVEELPYDIIKLWASHLPGEIRKIIFNIIEQTRTEHSTSIISLGFLFALWTAVSGVSATIRQLNHAYKIKETRSFLQLKATALLITCLFGCLFVLSFFLIVFGKNVVHYMILELQLPIGYQIFLSAIRYTAYLFILLLFFSVLYNFGPNIKQKKYHILNLGSLFASASFLAATHLFSFYLSYVNDYSLVYGSLGTIIGMMMWLYLLGYIIIVGAHINTFKATPKVSS